MAGVSAQEVPKQEIRQEPLKSEPEKLSPAEQEKEAIQTINIEKEASPENKSDVLPRNLNKRTKEATIATADIKKDIGKPENIKSDMERKLEQDYLASEKEKIAKRIERNKKLSKIIGSAKSNIGTTKQKTKKADSADDNKGFLHNAMMSSLDDPDID